jgi:colicin import membrane protein
MSMSRLEKKCLMASGGLHAFLLVVLVFGAAFFTAQKNEPPPHMIHLVPPDIIAALDKAGGGNPNIAPSNERLKGETLKPVPKPADPVQTQPKAVTPPPPPPTVKKETPKTEVKKAEPKAVTPVVKEPPKLPTEPVKPRIDLNETVPINRKDSAKTKEREAAEAKAAADAQRRANEKARAQREAALHEMRNALTDASTGIKRGFHNGIQVDVGGPGGAAAASYKTIVQMAYDNAWIVTPELTDKGYVAMIKVTIARDGRIISSRIIKPSDSPLMDRSVQKAMDSVRSEGLPPFPAGMTESEQTFTIEFNLKARSGLG